MVLFVLLSIYMCFAYFLLRWAIKTYVADSQQKHAQNELMQMFLVFVIDYVVTALYYCFYGMYYKIICSAFVRFMISDALQPVLDIPNIIAVCWLHY